MWMEEVRWWVAWRGVKGERAQPDGYRLFHHEYTSRDWKEKEGKGLRGGYCRGERERKMKMDRDRYTEVETDG